MSMSQQGYPPARPLYDRVEQIRIERGWTKVQLARTLGVSRGTLENWRTQRRVPLVTTIKDVAERLGIDYAEALELAGITREEDATPTEPTAPAGRHDRQMQLIREIRERAEELARLREQDDHASNHDQEAG